MICAPVFIEELPAEPAEVRGLDFISFIPFLTNLIGVPSLAAGRRAYAPHTSGQACPRENGEWKPFLLFRQAPALREPSTMALLGPLRRVNRFYRRKTTESSEDSNPCHNPVIIPYRDVSGSYLHVFTQIQRHYTNTNHLCQLFSAIYMPDNKDFFPL